MSEAQRAGASIGGLGQVGRNIHNSILTSNGRAVFSDAQQWLCWATLIKVGTSYRRRWSLVVAFLLPSFGGRAQELMLPVKYFVHKIVLSRLIS